MTRFHPPAAARLRLKMVYDTSVTAASAGHFSRQWT
jgi:hypothetical protein